MINIIARVTKDLESQVSPSGKNYVTFDVAENKGFGENAKTQFHRCTIWGEDLANRIVKAGVKKGSLLSISGEQDLSAYIKNNGEAAVQSSINVWHWDYVPGGSHKSGETTNTGTGSNSDVVTEECDDGLPV